eukprot:1159986-Pelagomonas_calceolata.AAC.3
MNYREERIEKQQHAARSKGKKVHKRDAPGAMRLKPILPLSSILIPSRLLVITNLPHSSPSSPLTDTNTHEGTHMPFSQPRTHLSSLNLFTTEHSAEAWGWLGGLQRLEALST